MTAERNMVPHGHMVLVVPGQRATVMTRCMGEAGKAFQQREQDVKSTSGWKEHGSSDFFPGSHIPTLPRNNYQKMSERKIQHTNWKFA